MKASNSIRFPAEWELHEATWLGWPRNEQDWPGKLEAIKWVFADIIKKIHVGERVRLIVSGESQAEAERYLVQTGVDLKQIDFIALTTDRNWTRDTGPLFVIRDGEKCIRDFNFNGWAKYENFTYDRLIPKAAAEFLALPYDHAQYNGRPFVLEGGAFDTNGEGSLLTTAECVLDQTTQVRNPGMSAEALKAALLENLGIDEVIMLGNGIEGDDTHGHVDDLCRFVSSDTIVVVEEQNRKDKNHGALADNLKILSQCTVRGSKPQIAILPMPSPVVFEGIRLPASYANFYICNAGVLVPTFNDPNDYKALGVLGDLFPGRKVIGIHALDLVWGFGTLHCLTQQEPHV